MKNWQSLEWGHIVGVMGRECCLWMALQLELMQNCLLQEKAMSRLNSLGFDWELRVRPQSWCSGC